MIFREEAQLNLQGAECAQLRDVNSVKSYNLDDTGGIKMAA